MTYNIRFNNPGDGPNAWPERREFLLGQVRYHRPDIMGTQEGMAEQIDYLDQHLANYDQVGVGRDDGARAGEFCTIFYRKDKFKRLQSGTFWLSPTPEKPFRGSKNIPPIIFR